MDDEVRRMSNKQLASNLHELSYDYMEGYTGAAVEYERDIMREAAHRLDKASEGKKHYTAFLLSAGPLIVLEGELEQYRRALVDSNGEDTLISGYDEQGRLTCIIASKIGAVYDYGEHNPNDFFF